MPRACRASPLVRILLLLVTLSVGARSRLQSQQAPDSATASAPWRVGAFIGAAHNSPTGSAAIGATPRRDHLFLALSAMTSILRAGPVRFRYAAQLLPLVLIRGDTPPPNFYYPGDTVPGGKVVYAFGLSPFGLQVDVPLGGPVSLFGAAAAGALIFERAYPIPEAGRINFTLEFGGGLVFALGDQHWIQAGYKYHHLSNAGTAAANPGVDANVFYAGFEWGAALAR